MTVYRTTITAPDPFGHIHSAHIEWVTESWDDDGIAENPVEIWGPGNPPCYLHVSRGGLVTVRPDIFEQVGLNVTNFAGVEVNHAPTVPGTYRVAGLH